MSFLPEKVVELAVDAGLSLISSKIRDRESGVVYRKTIEDYFDRCWDSFKSVSLDEEFDYEGLIDFFHRSDKLDKVRTAVIGSQSERRSARSELYNSAFEYAHARSNEARERIRQIVSTLLDALRKVELGKAPLEIKILAADATDEINRHSDDNTQLIIQQIKESLSALTNKTNNVAEKKYPNIRSAILDKGGRLQQNGAILLNIDQIDRDVLSYADDGDLCYMKEQLGKRLDGTENREEIITLFWAETKMTFQSGRRHDIMPLFQDVVRDTCTASIFVDDKHEVVDRVHLVRFYWDDYDIFHMEGEKYVLRVVLYQNEAVEILMNYNFGYLSDVYERQYCLNKIRPIVHAEKIHVKGVGVENHDCSIKTSAFGEEWDNHKELTDLWICWTNMIVEIQEYYHVVFQLPANASEEDYVSIDILFDSIHRRNCRTVKGLPELADNDIDGKAKYIIDEEISVGCPDCLKSIHLFGHTFRPVEEYVIPCELYWNEKNNCFETLAGGIPTGVKFELCD